MSTAPNPLKIAFIGGGGTTREHAKAFRDVPGATLAGIWNRSRDKAQAVADEFSIGYVATDIADLHAKTGADLVVLAVYETAINAVAKQAFALPWAVLMEKPVGLNLADAENIAAAAKGRVAPVFVGLNRRTLSSTQAVLADLSDDPGPRFIHVQDQQSLETARVIGHAPEVIQNWMYANSIHLVDFIPALGRGSVVAVTPVVRWNPEAPTVVVAKVEFDSGDVALYEGIWNGPGPWACTVTTLRRRWELRPLEKALFQNAGERTQNPVEPHEWDVKFKPGFRLQAEQVAGALRGIGKATTLDDALVSMRLVHEIFTE